MLLLGRSRKVGAVAKWRGSVIVARDHPDPREQAMQHTPEHFCFHQPKIVVLVAHLCVLAGFVNVGP